MSHSLDGHTVGTFAESPSLSWRTFFKGAIDTLRTWYTRERERQQLLEYLATDHRAASDIGVDNSDAREWARRPFWRA